MPHIIRMPQNISYYPSNTVKEDGNPVMVLDLRRSYACVIPAQLEGVDCVMVRPGQLQFISPDYEGSVGIENSCNLERSEILEMAVGLIKILKRGYVAEQTALANIFEQSFSRSYLAYPDDEMNMPAKLKFSWNNETMSGSLDAKETWLQVRPVIENVTSISMPDKQELLNHYQTEQAEKDVMVKENMSLDSQSMFFKLKEDLQK